MKYFNRTGTMISVTLTDGTCCPILPKRWVDVPSDKAGSSSIAFYVKKGVLVRETVAEDVHSVDKGSGVAPK